MSRKPLCSFSVVLAISYAPCGLGSETRSLAGCLRLVFTTAPPTGSPEAFPMTFLFRIQDSPGENPTSTSACPQACVPVTCGPLCVPTCPPDTVLSQYLPTVGLSQPCPPPPDLCLSLTQVLARCSDARCLSQLRHLQAHLLWVPGTHPVGQTGEWAPVPISEGVSDTASLNRTKRNSRIAYQSLHFPVLIGPALCVPWHHSL